jgi:hypothetical protein
MVPKAVFEKVVGAVNIMDQSEFGHAVKFDAQVGQLCQKALIPQARGRQPSTAMVMKHTM